MMSQESGHDFLTSLTVFVNLVLSGRCPLKVAPIFFGGRLLAMNKNSFGIRSIAILGDWCLSAQILLALTDSGNISI